MHIRVVINVEFTVTLDAHATFRGPEHVVVQTQPPAGQVESKRLSIHVVNPVVMDFGIVLGARRHVDTRHVGVVPAAVENVVPGNLGFAWLTRVFIRPDQDSVGVVVEKYSSRILGLPTTWSYRAPLRGFLPAKRVEMTQPAVTIVPLDLRASCFVGTI